MNWSGRKLQTGFGSILYKRLIANMYSLAVVVAGFPLAVWLVACGGVVVRPRYVSVSVSVFLGWPAAWVEAICCLAGQDIKNSPIGRYLKTNPSAYMYI